MESCFKTKSESLLDTEKHKKEISTLRNKIANLTKDLNIKTERERQLALRLEALRYVVMDHIYYVFTNELQRKIGCLCNSKTISGCWTIKKDTREMKEKINYKYN